MIESFENLSAAQFTKHLASYGGGSKKDGGDGMMGGLRNIFDAGFQLGKEETIKERYIKIKPIQFGFYKIKPVVFNNKIKPFYFI